MESEQEAERDSPRDLRQEELARSGLPRHQRLENRQKFLHYRGFRESVESAGRSAKSQLGSAGRTIGAARVERHRFGAGTRGDEKSAQRPSTGNRTGQSSNVDRTFSRIAG